MNETRIDENTAADENFESLAVEDLTKITGGRILVEAAPKKGNGGGSGGASGAGGKKGKK